MDIPRDLIEKIVSGNCIAYVGAGLSRAAGLPDWKTLLKDLLLRCEELGLLTGPDKAEVEQLIDKEKFLDAASDLTERMRETAFHDFMLKTFHKPGLTPKEVHTLLTQVPFNSIWTSNYDKLVETAYTIEKKESPHVLTHKDAPELSAVLRNNKFHIFKPHGTIDQIETVILSRKQYRNLMHSNPAYSTFITSQLSSKTFFFIGFSLTDPDLLFSIDTLTAAFKGYTGTHYALMDATKISGVEIRRLLNDYGIQVIPYTPSDNTHPEVKIFLEKLTSASTKATVLTIQDKLKPAKDILESDPNYKLVWNTENEFIIKEKYPGAAEKEPLQISMSLLFDTKTPEGKEAHELFKRHLETGEPITIKSPHLAEVVHPQIIATLMPDQMESMEVTIGPIRGEKKLPVKIIMEATDGEVRALDNIILENIQSGSKRMLLSNKHQGIAWKVELLYFTEGPSDFTLHFNGEGLNVKQELDGWRFWNCLSKGGKLRVEVIETGTYFVQADVEPNRFPKADPRLLEVLEALVFIQQKTPARFIRPDEVSVDDLKMIFTTHKILQTGNIEFPPTPTVTNSNRDQAKMIL
jgi:hypothetical protein